LKKFTAIFLTALLLVGIVAMSGCSKKKAAQQQEPQEKVMKIITEASFAPLNSKREMTLLALILKLSMQSVKIKDTKPKLPIWALTR
jgi:uncharacterized protein YcfL